MKVQVLYASKTGCTERLAKAILEGVEAQEKTLHNLDEGMPVLDGDIVLVGYWGISGGPCEEVKEMLAAIKGKAVGVFCTLGYYADTAYAHDVLMTGINLLKEQNEIIGSYVCNGAVAQSLIKAQGKGDGKTPTEQKELRWEMIENHPTAAECALGAERFRERVRLYCRCKELQIPFTPIV